MGLIQMGGLGSGLDVNAIVDAIVNAERAPKLFALDSQEARLGVTLSGLGNLKSALNEIRAKAFELSLPSAYSKKDASLSSQENIGVTGSLTALPGSYDIEVVELAQGSELSSGIFTSGGTTTFGDGSLIFTVGTESFEVSIDATDSLEDIQSKINNASNNIGITINVLSNITIGVDTGSLFQVSSTIAGLGNDLVVTTGVGSDASLDDLSVNLTLDQSATDAEIKIDGFTSFNTSNVFDELIQGVIITAGVKNESGETTTLTVKDDTDSAKLKITALVESLNSFLKTAKELGSANPDAPGFLLGDATLRQVQSQVRNALSERISGITSDYNSLSSLGVISARDGSLGFSSGKLEKAIENGFDDFETLFASDNGIASKLMEIIDGFAGGGGIIQAREESIQTIYTRINEQRLELDRRLAKFQTRLSTQFAVMDRNVARLNSTGEFLKMQLDALPGFTRNKK